MKKYYLKLQKFLLMTALLNILLYKETDALAIDTNTNKQELSDESTTKYNNNLKNKYNLSLKEYKTNDDISNINEDLLSAGINYDLPLTIASNPSLEPESVKVEEIGDELSYKINAIKEKFNWDDERLDIVTSIILKESKPDSYEDGYYTANSIGNRTKSIKWRNEIEKTFGEGTGGDIYYQLIAPGQYEVYLTGIYKEYLGVDKSSMPVYQGIIDYLYTEESLHNYLNFKASSTSPEGKVQLVPGGNRFHGELIESDIYNEPESSLENDNLLDEELTLKLAGEF